MQFAAAASGHVRVAKADTARAARAARAVRGAGVVDRAATPSESELAAEVRDDDR